MIAAALLAGIAAPIIGLVLKALGLIHGASLHTWLLDVGSNVDAGGATGAIGSGVSGVQNIFGPGQYGPYGNPIYDKDGNFTRLYIGSSNGQAAPERPNRFTNPATGQPYPYPQTTGDRIMQYMSQSVHDIAGSAETNKANGCTKA
jgi:hypothetical protein